jgi:hypothetical protein
MIYNPIKWMILHSNVLEIASYFFGRPLGSKSGLQEKLRSREKKSSEIRQVPFEYNVCPLM